MNLLQNIIQNVFGAPATREYPFVKRETFEGARGHITMDPNLCIYCGICAKKCPTNALAVDKDPKSWTLDPFKCIICNACVEVCPKKCIYMNKDHRAPQD